MQFLIFPVRNPEKYLRRSSLFSKKRETEKKDATFFFIVLFILHLNVKNLRSPGNLY